MHQYEFNLSFGESDYAFHNAFRTPHILMLEYQQFVLLHNGVFGVFGIALVPFQSVFTNVILYLNYMLAVHSKQLTKLDIFVLFSCMWGVLMLWATVLGVGGKFYAHSRNNIRSWKEHQCRSSEKNKVFNKWRKSCKPLSFGYKGVFAIRQLTVLKFLRSVVRGTFRCLLALKGRV